MKKKKKTICAFGSFDILHPGHLAYVAAASVRGGRLVVVVTPDRTFRKHKGTHPIFNQRERMQIVAALRAVDRVILGDSDDSWNVLKRIRPTLIYLGYDQITAKQSLITSKAYRDAGSPPIVFGRSYRKKRYHSSSLKSQIIHQKS